MNAKDKEREEQKREGHADAIALGRFASLKPDGVEDFRRYAPDFIHRGVWCMGANYFSHLGAPGRQEGISFAWQQLQYLVQKLWDNRFPTKESIRLITAFSEQIPFIEHMNQHFENPPPPSKEPAPPDPDSAEEVTKRNRQIRAMPKEELAVRFPDVTEEDSSLERLEYYNNYEHNSNPPPSPVPFPGYSPFHSGLPSVWAFQSGIAFLMMNRHFAIFCPQCRNCFVKFDGNQKYCSSECAQTARSEYQLGWWNDHGKKARSKRISARATKPVRARKER
jgi:hypothetical protein